MPTKQSKRQALREAHAKAARQEQIIKWAAIGVVAVIVIAILWSVLPTKNKTPEGLTIDVNKEYFATVKMEKGGEFVIQLFPDKAPITVDNFVKLARSGFYNGTTFHRVIDGFMAQGGDPTGTGSGGPGYEFQDEFSDLTFDEAGILAMANSGPNTNGSQFFITFAPTPHLNGLHTIFGKVIEGMEVVNGITRRDPSTAATPGDAIESITIREE
jgi:peptidylprolyl isomerase